MVDVHNRQQDGAEQQQTTAQPEDLAAMLKVRGAASKEMYIAYVKKALLARVPEKLIVANCTSTEYLGCQIFSYLCSFGYSQAKQEKFVQKTIDRLLKRNNGSGATNAQDAQDDELSDRELQAMLLEQGDASEKLFIGFVKYALQKAIADKVIIKACLNREYGGRVYKHCRATGGSELYIQCKIDELRRRKVAIQLNNYDDPIDEHLRTVEKALLPTEYVFVRNKRLVWVCWRTLKKDGNEYTSAEIELYTTSQLCGIIDHHAVSFELRIGRTIRYRPIACPEKIAKYLIDQHHYSLPEIIGIVNSPTLRPDLSLLIEPGYDPAMQIYHLPSSKVHLPPISDKPTWNEALAALKVLNDLLDGFAFDGEVEKGKQERDKSVARSGALAGILTTVVRVILGDAVPLFVVHAPDPRIGKTYLINLIALIATGHIPIPTAGSEKKEELEKRIETAALAARPIIHIDNSANEKTVESDRLSQLSTGGRCVIRKLGKHQEGMCDCRATTIFINGNNINISRDLVPRSVSIRLDPRMERPEQREFDNLDPHARVLADRGKYLAAAFTIIRAFKAAGAPKQEYKRVTGFEQWSRLVQQALIWLGMDDPLGGMEALRAQDPAQEEVTKLLAVLRKTFPKPEQYRTITVVKCKELADIGTGHDYAGRPTIFKYPELRELMLDEYGKINERSFGQKMTNSRDQIRDEWCIRLRKNKIDGRNAYFLAGPSPDAMAWEGTAPAGAGAGADDEDEM